MLYFVYNYFNHTINQDMESIIFMVLLMKVLKLWTKVINIALLNKISINCS